MKLNAVSTGATSLEGILSQWKHGNDWQVPQECDHTEGEREVKKKRCKNVRQKVSQVFGLLDDLHCGHLSLTCSPNEEHRDAKKES